jgi:hypothetical protein
MKTRSDLLRLQHKVMIDWVEMYLDAVSDEEFKIEVVPGRNTGVWILGHLIVSDDDLSLYITKEPILFPELQTTFKQGSSKQDPETYPSVSELRQKWKSVCAKNDKLFNELNDEILDQYHEMIQGDPEADYFKTKERVLVNWTFHQIHMAGELALLLGKAGKRLI